MIERLQRHAKGQVLVLVALLMFVMLGMTSLAIDIGRAYGVKAKLTAAVDAASFEAANALAQGNGQSGMESKAKEVALSYFNANFPREFLGATPSDPEVDPQYDSATGKWTVKVKAKAEMPSVFAGLVGLSSFNIPATSESVRATLDMVLVLDTSDSMSAPINIFSKVKSSAQRFVYQFDEIDDRLALVAFSSAASPIVSFCGNTDQDPQEGRVQCNRGYLKATIDDAIGTLISGGMTASAEGLKKALEQLNSLKTGVRSETRVIVFLSDGAPDTFNGKFPLSTPSTPIEGNLYSGVLPGEAPPSWIYGSRYGEPATSYTVSSLPPKDTTESFRTDGNRSLTANAADIECDANKAARNMAENVANEARGEGIRVYTIGLGTQVTSGEMKDPGCSTYNETGELILKRLANTKDSDTFKTDQPVGIYCHADTADDLGRCYDKVRYAILRLSK